MDLSIIKILFDVQFFIVSSIVTLFLLSVIEWRKIKRPLINNLESNAEVLRISSIIKNASLTYLLRQFKVLLIVESIIAILLTILINIHIAIAFTIGAIFSWLSGLIAMYVSVCANYKVTLLAKIGFQEAFDKAFSVGKLVGYLVKSFAMMLMYAAYFYVKNINQSINLYQILIGLSFGASLISIFARIGGGIFTKGADIGADLVGKIEQNIPEDDARNPAVIADNVGDNVGDCAGMAADLFESYIVIVSVALCCANYVFNDNANIYSMLVFTILASGAWASVIVLTGSWNINKRIWSFFSLSIALKTFFVMSIILINAFAFFFWGFEDLFALCICAIIGLFSAAIIMPITEYYTGTSFSPVKKIVEASNNGAAANILNGISIGFQSCCLPLLLIILSIMTSMALAGSFGIAIACVSMISVCAIILALDAFGPITDNAGGIAQMANLPSTVRDTTDQLDIIGNVTKATTKGYAVYSSAIAAIILSIMFKIDLMRSFADKDWTADITSIFVVAGFFIGIALIGLFIAFCLQAVNKASVAIITEVRAQFRNLPGIMNGTQKPLYYQAIDILTKASLKQMILPGLLPVITTICFFGFLLFFYGMHEAFIGLNGFIIGATMMGIFMAFSMTISGGAWDNAKKVIEALGNKGSEQHKAAVIGDTVGDPYKDTAGPSLNPLIKLIGIVSMLLVMVCAKK